ncbi:MAG: efflux transporter outer membrane subunit [Proteobacteria bacterium]|nr:efflux transporter outer membrane subunit [Pseudomonadota bacterium]MBU1710619.1 efflux transporter outer membrane subunit [Pseudomonadota bacterium]
MKNLFVALQVLPDYRPFQKITTGILCSLFFVACAPVGPDFQPPEPQTPASWQSEPAGGLSVEALDPANLAHWWTNFNDPVLSDLIARAVDGNLDLQLAQSRLQEARARLGLTRADNFPTLDATGSATRSRSHSQTQNHFALGFDASWELDIFGGLRRTLEASQADLDAVREDLRDVLVSLLGEVAGNYLETRTYQARLAAANENLKLQEATFQLTDWRYQAGLSDELAVQQARYNLASTRAQLPNLRVGLAGSLNRLAVLTGEETGRIHQLLKDPAPIPAPPATVAVGVPAETLRQRPDLRRAEQQLAAATARIGVAVSDLYPKFRLSGSIGLESIDSADILAPGSRSWRFGPSFSWPLFNGGQVRRNIEIQSTLQEQKLLQYRRVVLTALEEVENALIAYVEEQRRHEALAEGAQAAQIAAAVARDKYQAGLQDFSTVLDAQRSQLSFEDQLAQSQGAVSSNMVRLYKAMGGGWQNLAAEPSETLVKTKE